MENILEMIMKQKMPQMMMGQLEQQLKARNPRAFQSYQQARKNNENPNEFLNKTINSFDSQKKQMWEQMMNNYDINSK